MSVELQVLRDLNSICRLNVIPTPSNKSQRFRPLMQVGDFILEINGIKIEHLKEKAGGGLWRVELLVSPETFNKSSVNAMVFGTKGKGMTKTGDPIKDVWNYSMRSRSIRNIEPALDLVVFDHFHLYLESHLALISADFILQEKDVHCLPWDSKRRLLDGKRHPLFLQFFLQMGTYSLVTIRRARYNYNNTFD